VSRGTILIVKTGSAEPVVRRAHGDFDAWITRGLGVEPSGVRVSDVTRGESLPWPSDVGGVVVTGSAAMVSQPDPWTGPTARWLHAAVDAGTPLLGICYGHQLVALALGGRVGPNPKGREIGTVEVSLDAAAKDDALFGRLPAELCVHATHVESVLELPPGAVWLGESERERNHVVAFGPRAWGVQFHPEFESDAMRGYLAARADVLREEGLDPERLLEGVRDSPDGTAVLRRFRDVVVSRPR